MPANRGCVYCVYPTVNMAVHYSWGKRIRGVHFGGGHGCILDRKGAAMKNMKKTLVFTLLNLMVLAMLIPVPVAAQSSSSPRLMLMKYFTAINFRDFPL